MNVLIKVIFTFVFCLSGFFVEAASNSEVYVTTEADLPSLKYKEGQQAGFSIFETSGWTGLTEVEVFFQDDPTPLSVSDMATFRFVQTPVLVYGPARLVFNVYELEEELLYLLQTPRKNLLETFDIEFNVRYDDSIPPVLSVLPETDTIFFDDMPFMQVDYSDTPAGVDISTFKAHLIDDFGARTDITSLFTINADFATVQFDELHKLPIGTLFIEIEVADFNENLARQTLRYGVEVPQNTSGFFTGLVVDNQGQPVEGAEVSVVSGGVINRKSVTTTDANGRYKLSVGQGGDILLAGTKTGWTTQTKWVYGEIGKDTAVPTFLIKTLDSSSTFISKEEGGIAVNATNTVEFHVAPNSASNDIDLNITQAKAGGELPGPLPILTEFTFMGTMAPSGTTFSPPGIRRIRWPKIWQTISMT